MWRENAVPHKKSTVEFIHLQYEKSCKLLSLCMICGDGPTQYHCYISNADRLRSNNNLMWMCGKIQSHANPNKPCECEKEKAVQTTSRTTDCAIACATDCSREGILQHIYKNNARTKSLRLKYMKKFPMQYYVFWWNHVSPKTKKCWSLESSV